MEKIDAARKMVKARAGLVLDSPFFAAIALRMDLKEDPTCETAWTDGFSIGFNPEWIDTLTLSQTKGLICHEVLHVTNLHHLRTGNRDHERANLAQDFAIDPLIVEANFELPEGGHIHPAFVGKSFESIYPLIPETKNGKKGGGRGEGSRPGSPDGKPTYGEVRRPKGKDGQPLTQAEAHALEQETKLATQQAAQQSKAMGLLPAFMERLIDKINKPKVDWRERLQLFITTVAKNDYSWFPANRRFIDAGIYLPALRSEEMEDLIIGIDTSGSIDMDQLAQFNSELNDIVDRFHCGVHVIHADAEFQKYERFEGYDTPFVIKPKGGGGTDFRPVFQYVDKQGLEGGCLLYFTDGYCDQFPKEEPTYPVLWVLYGGMDEESFKPPFGEVIKVGTGEVDFSV